MAEHVGNMWVSIVRVYHGGRGTTRPLFRVVLSESWAAPPTVAVLRTRWFGNGSKLKVPVEVIVAMLISKRDGRYVVLPHADCVDVVPSPLASVETHGA